MAFTTNNLSRVNLTRNTKYERDGLKSYVYLLQKFNISPTIDGPYHMIDSIEKSGQQAALGRFGETNSGTSQLAGKVLANKDASGNSGMVPAKDIQHDSEYLGLVSMGTPKQTLKLDFDSGSSDLWVWSNFLSPDIQAQADKSGHKIFETNKSSTWKKAPGESWKIKYGDNSSASGSVGYDSVQIGGLTIHNQAIETATQMSQQFVTGAGDGLLGLGWGSINTVKPKGVKTPVENMILQEDIPKTAELFTAHLGSYKDINDPDKGQSFYTFGYIDQDVVKASGNQIHYVDVDNSQGFWQFSSPSAAVNGKNIERKGNTAIADTGTTLAMVDDKLCEEIYSGIPNARLDPSVQGWVYPSATSADKLPNVQFAVGGKLFTVQKEYIGFAKAGKGMVYGAIQSRGNLSFDILGDTFLKNCYVIFDQGSKRLGCVQRTEPSQNLTPPPPEQNGSDS